MKLKQIAQIIIISCGLIALGACSTTAKRGAGSGDAAVTDANYNGAESSGLGENSGFGGGEEGLTPEQRAQKRVYYFDFDSNIVHENDKPAIEANANYILERQNEKVRVEGHTDPRGSREYNIALGERRANAVADMLRTKGVSDHQLRVVSYGAERLAASGRTEEAYQQDRRAVIAYRDN